MRRLGFYGLLAQADTLLSEPWLERVLDIEDTERARRSLKRRLDNARLGAFKSIADFDWSFAIFSRNAPKLADNDSVVRLDQLIQQVSPLLHHDFTLVQIRGVVVSAPDCVALLVRELAFNYLATEPHLVQEGRASRTSGVRAVPEWQSHVVDGLPQSIVRHRPNAFIAMREQHLSFASNSV